MKTNVHLKPFRLFIPLFAIGLSFLLSNCKGHVEIIGITDSVINCSPPYVVYFYPEAEHRTKDLEYTWKFGDGSESHDHEAVHTYADYGTYEVTLSIKQNEAFDSKTFMLYLTPDSTAPIAKWDYYLQADSLWAPAYVQYLNDSEHAVKFLWEFGDGTTTENKVPAYHVFDTQGTFTTTLNAICGDDTSFMSRDMIIKAPPTDLFVDQVTVWMPSSYVGNNIKLEVWYDGFRDYYSEWIVGVSQFPVTFNVQEMLVYFNGVYDSDKLEFILFVNGETVPEIIFDVEARDLQSDYYPPLLKFDDGYGRKLEATIAFRD